MKLKRLFSAKKIFAAGFLAASFLFSSCASNDLSVPVPGQGAVKTRNIYVEYYMLGDAYFKLEDYKKAGEYYELAMRKKDQYWAAYYKLAKCYVFSSDWANALPMYKKILERDPDNASIKAGIAYIYSMQGDFKNSISIYEELLEAQPKNQEYLENYLAVMAADEKKFEKNYAGKFTEAYDVLKTFEDKYKELMKIVEEEKSTENSDGENTPPENEPAPQDKA